MVALVRSILENKAVGQLKVIIIGYLTVRCLKVVSGQASLNDVILLAVVSGCIVILRNIRKRYKLARLKYRDNVLIAAAVELFLDSGRIPLAAVIPVLLTNHLRYLLSVYFNCIIEVFLPPLEELILIDLFVYSFRLNRIAHSPVPRDRRIGNVIVRQREMKSRSGHASVVIDRSGSYDFACLSIFCALSFVAADRKVLVNITDLEIRLNELLLHYGVVNRIMIGELLVLKS